MRSGRRRCVRQGSAGGAAPARALGVPLEPRAERQGRRASVRRDEEEAHVVRGRQDRLPHAAHALSDLPQVHQHLPLRRVVRHQNPGRRWPGARCRGHRADDRTDRDDHGQSRDPLFRRLRARLSLHHQRRDQDRRWDGARVSRRRAAQGHGVHPVPSHRASLYRHPHHRGGARRGRLPDQQGRLPLPPGLRPRKTGAEASVSHNGARAPGSAVPGVREGDAKGADRRNAVRSDGASRSATPWREADRHKAALRAGAVPQVSERGSRQGAHPRAPRHSLHDGRGVHGHERRDPDRRTLRGG